MPVTETILHKRIGLPFCVLGRLDLYGIGISSYRNDFYPGGYNMVYGASYPSTTPDNIMRKVRAYGGTDFCPGPATRIYSGSRGGIYNGTCVDDNGDPVGGSPFEINDTNPEPLFYYEPALYPRWSSETDYDWQSTATGAGFTPLEWPSASSYFASGFGLAGDLGRSISMSYDSGLVPNDPAAGGGESHYVYAANFGLWADIPSVSCWNDGAQLVFNLVIHKVQINLSFVPGTQGYHTFTYGTPALHSTIQKTITIANDGLQKLEDIPIPVEIGYITYVNDFYVSSVTAP